MPWYTSWVRDGQSPWSVIVRDSCLKKSFVFLTFILTVTLANVGKFWEAHSRLYQHQSLQVITFLKARDEIYKIHTLLHRFAFKILAKFRQTFSHFYKFSLKNVFVCFCKDCSKFHHFFGIISAICTKMIKYLNIFSNFPWFRNEYVWNFQFFK